MAENFSEEKLAALLKSIEITKRDAEFDTENPPHGILSPNRMNFLKNAYLTFDPKSSFDKILSTESNRDILKKELKYIIKYTLTLPEYPISDIPLHTILKKYKIEWLSQHSIENRLSVSEIIMIFPDIVYGVMKKRICDIRPPMESRILQIYKNFQIAHLNIGILGLLPKGKRYGGFVKALIHIIMKKYTSNFSEEYLAICRVLYHSLITPHDKREKWFAKLEVKDSDCKFWSRTFDEDFPEHADIHKYFGQIA